MIIMLRHAEREPIRDPKKSADAPLTDEGRKHAEELGRAFSKKLKKKLVLLCSFPPRCTETAMFFARGYGLKKLKYLIVDEKKILERFWMKGKRIEVLKRACSDFWNAMLDWKKGKLNGAMSYSLFVQRCEELINKTYKQYCDENTALIIIAHDTTIMGFAWKHDINPFTEKGPDYLEGITKVGRSWKRLTFP